VGNPFLLFAALAAGLWLVVLGLPGRPWGTRERLEARRPSDSRDLSDVTAVIPARDEAPYIGRAVASLTRQGEGLSVVVVDDGSRDGTAETAGSAGGEAVTVVPGKPLPDGWLGKVWALEQGVSRVATPYVLLMDADIEMDPGTVAALRDRLEEKGAGLVSLMAVLRTEGSWGKLLIPPFIFFFKLLYPFARVNRPDSRVAAAAGGCVFLDRRALAESGGLAPMAGAVIDDCTLARRVKATGRPIWLGLTRSVRSLRPYRRLGDIWGMVERTAFTQLGYSTALLGLTTLAMVLAFWVPPLALVMGPGGWAGLLGAAAWGAMALAYAPTLGFYGQSRWWSLSLPLAGTLYLAMTWASAWRYWRGVRSRWKGRSYGRPGAASSAEREG